MKEALLYGKLKDQQVQCGLCYRRCIIDEGQRGYPPIMAGSGSKRSATAKF